MILDGGMGTLLHAQGLTAGAPPERWNITRPDVIIGIHCAYVQAGAQVITTNTFGANRLRYPNDLWDIIFAAVGNARQAIGGADVKIALDVGPTGKLLAPMGSLAFEEAVSLFRQVGELGVQAGADLFLVETMTDLTELRAAVVGLKEAANLPIFATFSVEQNGRLLTGAPVETAAVMLQGLGVAALGVNCGAGPECAVSVLQQLRTATTLPLIAQPNAGLPVVRDGQTCFDLSPEDFARGQLENYRIGATMLGGCCGTTPEHIATMAKLIETTQPVQANPSLLKSICGSRDIVCLPCEVTEIDMANCEDIEDLIDEMLDFDQTLVPKLNIDQIKNPAQAIAEIQQQVWRPLCFASADISKLERALRVYTGRALVEFHGAGDIRPLLQLYGGEFV